MQYIQYFCSIKVLNSSFLCSYTTYEYSELSKRFLKTNPERKFVLFLKPPQTSTKKQLFLFFSELNSQITLLTTAL